MTNSGCVLGPTVQITCRKVTKMADWRHCFGAKKANYQQESDEHDKCEVVGWQGTAALYDYFVIIIATTKGPKLGMQAGTTVKTRKANGGQDSHVVPSVGLQVSKSTAKPRSAPFPCAGKH